MSKYFQVLERLDRKRGAASLSPPVDTASLRDRADRAGARTAFRSERSAVPAVIEPSNKPQPTGNEPGPAASPSPTPWTRAIAEFRRRPAPRVELHVPPFATPLQGVETVFHNIDALTMGQRPMTLVFAGASATEAVQALTMDLTEYAERAGARVVLAELRNSGGDRVLVSRHPLEAGRASEGGNPSPLEIDLHGGSDRETLARWRESLRPGADIMLLIGPPLVDSVDAVLLASLCDGLVMVAVHEETHRAALTVASERARLAKSPTFGVVVHRRRDAIPSWLRRIMER